MSKYGMLVYLQFVHGLVGRGNAANICIVRIL